MNGSKKTAVHGESVIKKLTPSDELCIQEYIKNGGKKSDAFRFSFAKRVARWKDRTIHTKAYEFFERGEIQVRLEEISQKVQKDTGIDAEYVLRQAVKLHERCMQEIEPITDRKGKHLEDAEGRPLYIFNAAGSAKALELVGKHRFVQAFEEKRVVETNVNIVDRAVSTVDEIIREALYPGQNSDHERAKPH